VTYKLPRMKEVVSMIQTSGEENDINFSFHPFQENSNCPVYTIPANVLIKNGNVTVADWEEIDALPTSFNEIKPSQAFPTSKDSYLKQAHSMIDKIQSGALEKAVLSRIKTVPKPYELDEVRLFHQLSEAYPNAFVYLFHHPIAGTWMGATPETLYTAANGTVSTMALAGTQKNTGVPLETVQWKEKERHEQAVVSDYIDSLAAKHQLKLKSKKGPVTSEAGNVVHLKTTFEFQLPTQKTLTAFLSDLHPTPAVCGLPKDKALALIEKTEVGNRGYYAGFLGPDLETTSYRFVNLRCMRILDDDLVLFVGGGLTAGSDPEKEWEETELKARTLLAVVEKN
jgi:isochorismate synthase